ncbi:MAG: hypothetical protein ACD_20C00357G0015 [uncultured bacterium]|nr:MAG: hypothetical protein ACD_20C00357G0015 [uncultured bacterium]HBH17353.1 hypothetical protein [Cyanobacteria bacterium UBA9579]
MIITKLPTYIPSKVAQLNVPEKAINSASKIVEKVEIQETVKKSLIKLWNWYINQPGIPDLRKWDKINTKW